MSKQAREKINKGKLKCIKPQMKLTNCDSQRKKGRETNK